MEQPQAPAPQEGQPQEDGDPKAQLQEAIDGILSATEAMTVVAQAFDQMGQKAPAAKLAQAAEMAKGALQEMMGGAQQGQKPVGMNDPNAGGNPNARPVA